MIKDEKFMALAIEQARAGIAKGNAPFGAVFVKDGQVLVEVHNTVRQDPDPTAHAEVNAIRKLTKELKTLDLSGYTLYSTCEPCPMCTSAIAWANIKRVVFGTKADAFEADYPRQFTVFPEKFFSEEGLAIEVVGGVLQDEVMKLYSEYVALQRKKF